MMAKMGLGLRGIYMRCNMTKEPEEGGVSQKARTALNLLAVRAIETAQRMNQTPSRVDPAKIRKALDEIQAMVQEARQELSE
jgi:hypothetical protein